MNKQTLDVGIKRVVYRIFNRWRFCRHEYAQANKANAA